MTGPGERPPGAEAGAPTPTPARPPGADGMARAVDAFADGLECVVVTALVFLMGAVVLLAMIELAWIIARDVLSPPVIILELHELLDIFGFFLLILIGLELLETVKAYLAEHVVHVNLVVEVALIAIARKVIVLDVKEHSPITLIGIAALILALAAAHHLQRRHARRV